MLVKLLLVGLLSFHISLSFAQLAQGHYTINNYNDENGLPQNSVKSIAADQQGFVWFITESGLVRFDGRHFYNFSKQNLPLKDNRFYAMIPSMQNEASKEDRGRFYAATDQGDYVKVANGRATHDSLYFHKTKKLPAFKEYKSNAFIASGLPIIQNVPNLSHYTIPVAGGDGSFYVCDSSGATFYSQWKKKTFYPFTARALANYFLFRNKLYYYFESGHIAAPGRPEEGIYALSGAIISDPSFAGAKKNIKIYWNIINDQVFLNLGNNLYELRSGADNKLVTDLIVKDFDFTSRNIQTIYYNKMDQSVFLGSVTQGLFVLRGQPFQSLTTGTDDHNENVFYAQTPFGKDAVLIPRGIVLKKEEDGNIQIQRLGGNLKENGPDNRGILTDRNGMRWVKNYQYLSRYNQSGDKRLNQWDLKDEIKTIYCTSDGTIWAGLKKRGLFRVQVPKDNPSPEPFLQADLHDVSFITSLTKQQLLVGTEHGLYTVNLSTKKAVLMEGTRGLFIKSIHAPEPGQIWITAQDKGIMLFYQNRLTVFPVDENKYLNASHCLFEDKNGFFWITTNKGLFRAKKSEMLAFATESNAGKIPEKMINEFSYEYYDKNAGFLSNEFNGGCQPCALRLENGTVSLPSLNGLIWFNPEKNQSPDNTGKIYFDHFSSNQKSFPAAGEAVTLPTDAKAVQFHFSTPYFGHPNNLRFYYALVRNSDDNKDPEWNPVTGHDLSIYFSSLSSGHYTLLVKRVSGFGSKNYSIKKLEVIVPPLWYETWIFRLILLFVIAGVIYGLIRLRTRYLERKNHDLERKIKERTFELESVLSNLQQSQKELTRQLTIRTRLVASMSHDIMTPMSFLTIAAERIEPMIRQQKYEQASLVGNDIAVSARHIRQLLENTISYIKTQYKAESIPFEEVALQNLVNQKITIFAPAIRNLKNSIVNEIDTSIAVLSSHHLLGIIIHNIIDNANKFTSNGSIRIYTEQNQTGFHLIVADSGPGIPADLLQWLNGKDLGEIAGNNPDMATKSHGLGLMMVREIAALLDIKILAESRNGTLFHLIFNTTTVR